ncbi:MAG: response regulator [Nitrospirae bacterium]|nr:MAG: response regulator [Nitrospirota bacterium]
MTAKAKANILLVDDHPESLLALEAVLADLGQNLVKADSGRQALRCVLNQDFAVILLDVNMPGMDGFETAALIRERERSMHTPIVFLTGRDQSELAVFRGYSVGAVDYLIKPFAPEILKSKVAVFVDLFQMREKARQQANQLVAINQNLEREIAERKRAEAEIKRRADELEAANKELEAFSYSVSHDLRTPLRAMQGFAQALNEDFADRLGPVAQDYTQRIVAAACRMDSLIQDLLAYSRLSRAQMLLQPLDLRSIMAQIQAQTEGEFREREAVVEAAIPEAFPHVMAHATTLVQVVTNLLTNAVKFVASGVRPHVRVWAEERGEWGRLWVEDNGIGIAPEHQVRIFRVFERLHGSETYPGTGIGLAIAAKGMERMGGRAGVESTPGKGSKFWIELPKGDRPS